MGKSFVFICNYATTIAAVHVELLKFKDGEFLSRESPQFSLFFSRSQCAQKKVVFHLLSAVLNNFELHLNTERNKRTCGSSSNYFRKRVHVTKERHCTKVQKFCLFFFFFCMTIKK